MKKYSLAVAATTLVLTCTATLSAEAPETRGRDCYQIGYRFAKCALGTAAGLSCPAGWDFVVPPRCKGTMETRRGINEGTEDFYAAAAKYLK